MRKQQVLKAINKMMETFKNNGSSCGIRQYLATASVLQEYEKRISYLYNAGETVGILELEEIMHNMQALLGQLNLPITVEKDVGN